MKKLLVIFLFALFSIQLHALSEDVLEKAYLLEAEKDERIKKNVADEASHNLSISFNLLQVYIGLGVFFINKLIIDQTLYRVENTLDKISKVVLHKETFKELTSDLEKVEDNVQLYADLNQLVYKILASILIYKIVKSVMWQRNNVKILQDLKSKIVQELKERDKQKMSRYRA